MNTCIAMNFFAASDACLPICRGSMTRTTISPLRSTASRAAAVAASWSFSTVSICLNISVLIPLTCNDMFFHFNRNAMNRHFNKKWHKTIPVTKQNILIYFFFFELKETSLVNILEYFFKYYKINFFLFFIILIRGYITWIVAGTVLWRR